ncbi:MAG: phage virion morphogenesis protein [Methylococcales bacterium]
MITVDVVGLLPLKKQLQLLMMPYGMRRRLLYRVAQRVMRDSRKRIRTQTDLNGAPFKPGHNPETDTHSHKRGRRKMLAGLSKMMRVIKNNSVNAVIGFPGIAGLIAAKHQFGFEETVTSESLRTKARAKGAEHYNNPATKKQAVTLRRLGFKVKVGGRVQRPPSIKYITSTYTIAAAGWAIKKLKEWEGIRPKQSWLTRLPARSFLGATVQEVTDSINTISETILQGISRGTR